MENNIYRETFVKTTSDPWYVYEQVCECHTAEYGWTVGEPKIQDLGNGEYRISIPLEQDRSKKNDYSFGGR